MIECDVLNGHRISFYKPKGAKAMDALRLSSLALLVWLSACTVIPTPTTVIPPTTMNAREITPSLTPTEHLQPATAYPPQPVPASTPTSIPEPSVFLISWDGGRADMIYDWIETGALPTFARLAHSGVRAAYARSVDPPVTAAAQYSIATGSYPYRTGVVSNAYHNYNDSFYWYRLGFETMLDQGEPIWVTASKSGLSTASIFFVGGTPLMPGQMADYTIGYGIRDAYSKQVTVTLEAATGWQNLPVSYSPALQAEYHIPEVAAIHLLATDTTDDQQTNYNTVYLTHSNQNTDRIITGDTIQLQEHGWRPVTLIPQTVAGAYFLIQSIQPTQIVFYHTNVYHNTASPRQLLEALNDQYGFFHAGADAYAFEHGWITAEDNLFLMELSAHWMAEVTAWVYATYRPQLLFTWQDGFDAGGHFFFPPITQQNETNETNPKYVQSFSHLVQTLDQALETMLRPVNLEQTTVMIVSDHGMAPLHTDVFVNTLLEQEGLLVLDRRNYVVVEKSQAFAVASGGAANIYINLAGREREGIVSSEDYAAVQNRIATLFSNLIDPNNGAMVFERVVLGEDLSKYHLDHANSGDVFVQAYPGYGLDDWRGNDFLFTPSIYRGQHGYDSARPDMMTPFIAAGRGVTGKDQVIPPVEIVDYAPTIAHLLGFQPSVAVDGKIIPAFNAP
jgi:predicted AlkP superfamily pyrophosphatase or phosphodiesterase